MRVLEDLGFYCVDNMPVALAESVMRLATRRDPQLAGVANVFDPWARDRGKYYSLAWKPRADAIKDPAFATP